MHHEATPNEGSSIWSREDAPAGEGWVMQLRIDRPRTFVDEFTHKGVLVRTAEWEGPNGKGYTAHISGRKPTALARGSLEACREAAKTQIDAFRSWPRSTVLRRTGHAERRTGRQGRIADHLTRMDFIVLDELGYLPFAQSGGQFLFHLVSRL
jgi:IstB-like ATP binding protein